MIGKRRHSGSSLDLAAERFSHQWVRALLVWIALSLLLGATVAAAYVPLGSWNLVLALAIAAAKATLVVIFFMQITRSGSLSRLAGLAGLLWLAVMFALTFADEAVRLRPQGW